MNLKAYIKQKYKIIHIARSIGMSPQLLSYHLGKRDIPAMVIKKISDATGEDVDNLLKFIKDEN